MKSQKFLAAYRPGEFFQLHLYLRNLRSDLDSSSFSSASRRHCRSVNCSQESTNDIWKYAARNEFFQELCSQIRAVAHIADSVWNPCLYMYDSSDFVKFLSSVEHQILLHINRSEQRSVPSNLSERFVLSLFSSQFDLNCKS